MLREKIQSECTQALHNLIGIIDVAPRVGKTKILIDAIRDFKGSILVVYPYNNIGDTWRSEIEKWDGREVDLYNQRSIPDEKYDLVICDEIHSLSDEQISRLKGNRIIGATGSLSKDTEKTLKKKLNLDVVYRYSVDQAIGDGLISDYLIHVILLDMDDDEKYVDGGTKKKPFKTTELKNYNWLTSRFNYFKYQAWNNPDLEPVKMAFAGKRARAIYGYKSKLKAVKTFLQSLERYMVFTVLHDSAEYLCENQYHSNSEGDELEKLINQKINKLAVCQMVSMGKIYCELKRQTSVYKYLREYFSLSQPSTFYDKKCTDIQCEPYANRSFKDLLSLCRTVYPSVTEVQLMEVLDKLYKKEVIDCLYCPDIERIVFYKDSDPERKSLKRRLEDIQAENDEDWNEYEEEFGYDDKYTPEYLLNLLAP